VFAADPTSVGMLSVFSWATIPSESSDTTTRSGEYLAIASAFGLYPDRSVFGALAGKLEYSSAATTC
jgi:hypothetical protein